MTTPLQVGVAKMRAGPQGAHVARLTLPFVMISSRSHFRGGSDRLKIYLYSVTRLSGGSCIILHYCPSVYRVVLSYVEGKVPLDESAETTDGCKS